jgi:hypothetical protein
MSTDFPIQDTPAVPAGAQEPLSTDAELYSRNANTVSQVFRSFPPSPEVPRGTVGLVAPVANNREHASVDQMAIAAPVAVSVKQVAHRAIQGSNAPNDFRAHAADAVLPANPAPRQPVGQAQLNSKLRAIDGK